MRHGSSYDALDTGLRTVVATTMAYFQVDCENKKFMKILDNIVKDIKEGKQVCNAMTIDKTYWDK